VSIQSLTCYLGKRVFVGVTTYGPQDENIWDFGRVQNLTAGVLTRGEDPDTPRRPHEDGAEPV
jgi:hypothetical protein